MKRSLLIMLSVLLLNIPGLETKAAADQNNLDGAYLSMMGGGGGMMGGGMMGGGGGRMNNRGYGGSGDRMGTGTFGQDRSRENNFNTNRFKEDRHRTGSDYRQDERPQLREELRAKRRELSNLIRFGNADPDEVDRKINEIERLEHRFDDRR